MRDDLCGLCMLCSLPPELLTLVLDGCHERDHLSLSHACGLLRTTVYAHVHHLQDKRLHALLQSSYIDYTSLPDARVMKLHLEHVTKTELCPRYRCGVCHCAVEDVACCRRCSIASFPWVRASIGPILAATGLLFCAYRRYAAKA